MNINVRAYKLFFKYLLSYLFILFVPLLILGSLIYFYFIGIFQQEVMTNSLNKLDRIRYVIDDQLKQINVINKQIYFKNLNLFFFEENPLEALDTISELKSYSLTNSFITDILLYNHGDNYIYSTSSTYKLPFMFKDIYAYEQWNESTFIKDMDRFVQPVIRPMETVRLNRGENVSHFVTFIYPLSSGGSAPNKTVLFLISEQSFQNLLKDTMKDYGGNTLVLDNKSNIIAALHDDPILQSNGLQEMLASSTDEWNQIVKLDDAEYMFSCVVSPESGWKYITIVPVQSIMEKVNTLKLIFLYSSLFILIFGGGAIYYLMRINYRPIIQLKKLTEKFWKDDNPHHNELGTVQSAFEFLNNQNTELHARLGDYSVAAKEYLLFQLIKGQFQSHEALQQKAQSLGISFTKPWFRVVILHLSHAPNMDKFSVEPILETIEQSLPVGMEGYARDHMDQKNIVVVMASDVTSDAELEQILASIQSRLNEELNIVSTIGVGEAYQEVSQIPKSYIESMTAIDYRLVKGTGQVIFSREFGASRSRIASSFQSELERLKMYIKQGDFEQIDAILDKMIHYLKNDKPSLFEAKMIGLELINTVVHTVEEVYKQQSGAIMDYPDVFLLYEYETVDELAGIVKKLSNDIHDQLQKVKQNHKLNLIEQMKDYLQTQYTDCDFTIQQMADHFNMSLANLSQYFKEHAGSNVLDFETNLKLDKAKQLLTTSQMPIKDIALEVGYYNVNSFIRRFKQVIGITPGDYRKQYHH